MQAQHSCHKGKVLVLGNDSRVLLAVIRSLGRRGLSVHAGWCPADAPALRSRYLSRVHDLAGYDPQGDRWKNDLIRLMKQERFDLVVPCNDPAVVPLQLHRQDFEPHGRIYLLDDRAFQVAFDKLHTDELARSLGIPVPNGLRVNGRTPPHRVFDVLHPPVFVKPRSSVTGADVLHKRPVRPACNARELNEILQQFGPGEEVLVQERVGGIGVGVEVLADRGEVLVAFQHVRLHESETGGSTYRQSVAVQPELREAAGKLMKALDYTGVAMVEFRVILGTGQWALMEINGRFWGSLPLAVAAGADFPYYLFQLLVEGRREFSPAYRTGICCRNLVEDLRWMWRGGSASGPGPSRLSFGLLRDAWRIATLRDHIDHYAADDRIPGLFEIRSLLQSFTRKAQSQLRRFSAKAAPIVDAASPCTRAAAMSRPAHKALERSEP